VLGSSSVQVGVMETLGVYKLAVRTKPHLDGAWSSLFRHKNVM
jgi:hypothetical protein